MNVEQLISVLNEINIPVASNISVREKRRKDGREEAKGSKKLSNGFSL